MRVRFLGAAVSKTIALHPIALGLAFSALVIAWLIGPTSAAAQTLYAIEFADEDFATIAEIDPTTGADISTLTSSFMGSRGMATDPTTGTMYAIRSYKGSFDLVTIDPSDGSTSTIGTFANAGGTLFPQFRDITFDGSGQMWGVTGMNGDLSQSVLPIDKATATVGSVLAAVSGSAQMTIAYRPADGLLYVYSLGGGTLTGSSSTDGPATRLFESIDPGDATVTPIALSGTTPGAGPPVLTMVFDPPNNLFRFFTVGGTYWTLSPSGVQTNTGNSNTTIYIGLGFDQTTTIPVELMSFGID